MPRIIRTTPMMLTRKEIGVSEVDGFQLCRELCGIIIADRLAGCSDPELVQTLNDCAALHLEANKHVVLDVHSDFPMTLLESWSFHIDAEKCGTNVNLKPVIKSMLCYSKFHAWRRQTDMKGLAHVRMSVHTNETRLPFTDATTQQPCPIASSPIGAVVVLFQSRDTPLNTILPIASTSPPSSPEAPVVDTAAAKLASLRMTEKDVSRKHFPVPISSSPDPRKRAAPAVSDADQSGSEAELDERAPAPASPNSKPITIPITRSAYLLSAMQSPLSASRTSSASASSATQQKQPPAVDHRGIFLVSPPRPVGLARSRSPSLSRTPPSAKFVGSFEESLFTGRLPATSATPVHGFYVDLCAAGVGRSSPRVRLPMATTFYHMPGEEAPSPYVGLIDLCEGLAGGKHSGLFAVPPAGLVQLVLCNPEKTGLKVFAIKYDFRAMPCATHTFLRQRTFVSSSAACRGTLRFAAHLRFMRSRKGQVYLYQDIRIIFSPRTPEVTEHQVVTCEGPSDPVYAPCDSVRPYRTGAPTPTLNDSGVTSGPSLAPVWLNAAPANLA